jgi:FkbM family methyltransferase
MHLPSLFRSPLAHLLRTLPLRGRWRVAPVLNRLFSPGPADLELAGVGLVRLDLADEDQLQIYWTGLHADDVKINRLVQSLLPADGIFLDVGANIGVHTLAAARRVAVGGGAVIAFEPHPRNYLTLIHNLGRNHHHHVVAHNAGLAEKRETLTCHGSASGGNWSLASKGDYTFEVRLLRLDDYLLDHPLPRLDVMKIDVEGAEVRVLRGAKAAIARFRPVIIFESCPAWLSRLNSSNDELLGTLWEMGYEVKRLPEDGRLTSARGVAGNDLAGMGVGDWTNLVAVPAAGAKEERPSLVGRIFNPSLPLP